MRAFEISDRESLKAWLDALPQADEVQKAEAHRIATAIAFRAAMRLLPRAVPILRSEHMGDHGRTPQDVFRPLLVAGVASVSPTHAVRFAAASAFASAREAARAVNSPAAAAANAALNAAANSAAIANSAFADPSNAALNVVEFWEAVEEDCKAVEDHATLEHRPLWSNGESSLSEEWQEAVRALRRAGPEWEFWINWYEKCIQGSAQDWAGLLADVALIAPEDWEAGPQRVAGRIRDLEMLHTVGNGTPLSQASFADFDFNAAMRQLEMVGFKDDLAHLRDPRVVQRFLEDIEELRDGFQDFIDFSNGLQSLGNNAGVVRHSAEKVLAELQRTEQVQHLRPRRLIMLGRYLFSLSLEEDKRASLGNPLAEMLDANVNLLRETYHQNFGPSLERLQPLADLHISDFDPQELLVPLRACIERIRSAEDRYFAQLSPEASASLREMVLELEELKTVLLEAQTPEHRRTLLRRFTQSYGGVAATVGRALEEAKPHARRAGEWSDSVIKNYKRWRSISDIWEWLTTLGQGGPPPG